MAFEFAPRDMVWVDGVLAEIVQVRGQMLWVRRDGVDMIVGRDGVAAEQVARSVKPRSLLRPHRKDPAV